VGTQRADGGWTEEPFTGTGFPRVFYLKYHMYPVYFPLMALGRYAVAVRGPGGDVGAIKTRTDVGHAVAGPKAYRTTLAEHTETDNVRE
jgi:hypothetical protein